MDFKAIHTGYEYQITDGCGSATCSKPYCLSNPRGCQSRNGRFTKAAARQHASNLVMLRGQDGLCVTSEQIESRGKSGDTTDATNDSNGTNDTTEIKSRKTPPQNASSDYPKTTLSHSMLKTRVYNALPSFEDGSWSEILDLKDAKEASSSDKTEKDSPSDNHDIALKSMTTPMNFLIHLIKNPGCRDNHVSAVPSRKPVFPLNHYLFAFHSRIQFLYGLQFMGDAVFQERALLWDEIAEEEALEVLEYVESEGTEPAKMALVGSMLGGCGYHMDKEWYQWCQEGFDLKNEEWEPVLVSRHTPNVSVARIPNLKKVEPYVGLINTSLTSSFASISSDFDSHIIPRKSKDLFPISQYRTGASHDQSRLYSFRRMYSLYNGPENLVRKSLFLGIPMVDIPKPTCFCVHISRTRDEDILQQLLEYINGQLMTSRNLQLPLKVEFSDGEVALDLGGVQLELFDHIGRLLVGLDSPYFQHDDNGTVWPRDNPDVPREQWICIGVVIGLALFNGCPLSFDMPLSFYRNLRTDWDEPCRVREEEFEQQDPVAYSSLDSLRRLSQSELEGMGLTLKDGTPVKTEEDISRYIHQYINTPYTSTRVNNILNMISFGFQLVYPKELSCKMPTKDLKRLIEGSILADDSHIDVEPLLEQFVYEGGYTESSPQVKWLKEYLRALSVHQLKVFLHFTTGSERVSIGSKQGQRVVKITVQLNGTNVNCLPSASTCFCILFLPRYESKEVLVRYMDKAMEHSVGFGLM
ncbi:Ubiquitin-protein ligase E3A [Yarrowia sp. E02]|nr:Ubiquitin-protein ligase E3A [Yarrowia sp. E02]